MGIVSCFFPHKLGIWVFPLSCCPQSHSVSMLSIASRLRQFFDICKQSSCTLLQPVFENTYFTFLSDFKQDATLSHVQPRDAPYIWVPWKLYVSAQSADDCARIVTLQILQSYHYSVVKSFSKCSQFPSNVIRVAKCYKRTDRRTIYCGITAW